MTAPSVDTTGSGPVGAQASSTNTISLTVITGIADDIIELFIGAETNAETSAISVASVSSVPALAWARRCLSSSGGTYSQEAETWWAHVPTAESYAITIDFSATFDDASAIALPITGANTSAPFDVNVSLPAVNTNDSPSLLATISTTASDALVIGFVSGPTSANAPPLGGTSSPLVALAHQLNGGAVNYQNIFVLSESYSSPQTDLACAVLLSAPASGSVHNIWMVDAIVPPGAAPPPRGAPHVDPGSAVVTAEASTASAMGIDVVTSVADDIIVLLIGSETSTGYNTSTPVSVSSITSSPALTWALRVAVPSVGGNGQAGEEWWAHAPTANTYDITIDFSAAFDDAIVIGIPITGADITTPFDVNDSLPVGTYSGTSPVVSTISTTAADTLIIGFGSAENFAITSFDPLSSLASKSNGGGIAAEVGFVYSAAYTTVQSGLSITLDKTGYTYNPPQVLIIDAIQAAGAAPVCYGFVGRILFQQPG